MRLLLVFGRRYPGRSVLMLVCLSLAAMAEGVGLSSMLPLLGMVTDSGGEPTGLELTLRRLLSTVGLTPTVEVLLGIIMTGSVVKAALVLIAQKQVGYTVAHVATDLRLELLRSVLAARWPYYVRQPVGMLSNSFATEASRAADAYLNGALMVAQVIETLLYGAVAVMISWQTALASALVGIVSVTTLGRLVRTTRRAGKKQTNIMRAVLGRLSDVLYAVKPLKAMGREPLIAPLLEGETQRLNRVLRRQVLSKEAVRALQEPFIVVSLAGGLFAATQIWALQLDSVIVLALVFARALFSLNKAQKFYQAMTATESAFWSIRKTIADSDREAETNTGTREPSFERAVSLRDVDFAYGERPLLRGVSLAIPAGEITAVIGPSGAGKTTIADLVLGLVRPQRGETYLDDLPLSEVDIMGWRHMVGYVPQEMLLLHESVRTNVTLGDPQVTEADVEEALRAAGAWDFVCELPQGMDTPLGERGARLSGGQRQRISIARALVHRPRLVILDEATAALDPGSEAEIHATVRALRGKTTILAISHQPALLAVADRVYRLEDGRITMLERDETGAWCTDETPLRARTA
ncbi:MAG TPA: ABC transporter ATP-binding protein [Candidatus Limnocylindrales bacterium]|nr:ABC transporter ATP-binding protein [Candidatus Limnocylindrales bacterium]